MATVKQYIVPTCAEPPTSNAASTGRIGAVDTMAFDASTEQSINFPVDFSNYGSGNVTCYLDIAGDPGVTTGGAVFGLGIIHHAPDASEAVSAATAGGEQNFATENILGTTAQRLARTDSLALTGSTLDSIANWGKGYIRIARKVSDSGDTASGLVHVLGLLVSFSDT